MNIQQIREMTEVDLKIDGTELAEESIRIPQIHGKYLSIYHDETLILRKYEMEFQTLRKQKWEYYSGKMSQDTLKELGWEPFDHRILRNDYDVYLEADPDLLRLQAKIGAQKAKVDFLDATIKGINNRQWIIRNAIDFLKFKSGVT
jgi:hypothetical protein